MDRESPTVTVIRADLPNPGFPQERNGSGTLVFLFQSTGDRGFDRFHELIYRTRMFCNRGRTADDIETWQHHPVAELIYKKTNVLGELQLMSSQKSIRFGHLWDHFLQHRHEPFPPLDWAFQ